MAPKYSFKDVKTSLKLQFVHVKKQTNKRQFRIVKRNLGDKGAKQMVID